MQPEIAQRIAATEMLKKKRRRCYSDDDLRPNLGPRVWPAWPIAWLERRGETEVRREISEGVVDYVKSPSCDESRVETIIDRYPFLMTSDDENHDGTASERILKLSNYCWNEPANGFELRRRKSRKDGVTLSCRTFITDEGFRIYTFPASFWMIPRDHSGGSSPTGKTGSIRCEASSSANDWFVRSTERRVKTSRRRVEKHRR